MTRRRFRRSQTTVLGNLTKVLGGELETVEHMSLENLGFSEAATSKRRVAECEQTVLILLPQFWSEGETVPVVLVTPRTVEGRHRGCFRLYRKQVLEARSVAAQWQADLAL